MKQLKSVKVIIKLEFWKCLGLAIGCNINKESKEIVESMECKLQEITNGYSLDDVSYDDETNKQETTEVTNVKQIFQDMGYV